MKCARELLRDMPVMDKGEKAEEASGFETGRKQDWVGRVSGGNAVLRKFQPGRRDFLKPKSPVRGVPRFTRVDLRGYPRHAQSPAGNGLCGFTGSRGSSWSSECCTLPAADLSLAF